MAHIIEVSDLSHKYSENTPFAHDALQDVSFAVNEGEILGIIGHTGSGKSTLIQHLNGLLRPTAGRVLFRGRDIWSDKEFTRAVRFHVGLVFQYPEYQLFEETVARDIAFGPTNMGLSEDEIAARVRDAAASVGLSDALLSKSPFELSGGQKRRVALAGVRAMRPEVLILDEPTAGLDPQGREEILQYIRNYNRETGATILLVSHSMDDIARIAERILVLQKGRVLLSGSPREVFARAEDLTQAGLAVPQVTQICMAARALGVPIDPALYTLEDAAAAILALCKGGSAHA